MKIQFVNHLICINHSDKQIRLKLNYLNGDNKNECSKGLLYCTVCDIKYPIIEGIAIVVKNISEYIQSRIEMYDKWLLNCTSKEMKEFLKEIGKTILSLEGLVGRCERKYKNLSNGNLSICINKPFFS